MGRCIQLQVQFVSLTSRGSPEPLPELCDCSIRSFRDSPGGMYVSSCSRPIVYRGLSSWRLYLEYRAHTYTVLEISCLLYFYYQYLSSVNDCLNACELCPMIYWFDYLHKCFKCASPKKKITPNILTLLVKYVMGSFYML